MKLFTTASLLLVLCFIQHTQAQYENIRIDQEDYYQKDPASPNSASVLVYVTRGEYHYDNGGNKHTRIESFSRPIGTTEWQKSFQIINSYNEDNNILTAEYQNYDGSQYQPLNLTDYTYDDMNENWDLVTTSIYNGMGWTPSSQSDYTFNPDNTLAEIRTDNYNILTSSFDYQSKTMYSYTMGILTSLNAYTYNGTAFVDDYRATFTNTAFGEPEYVLYEDYDGMAWQNWLQINYNYFGEILLSYEEERWDDTLMTPAWVKNNKTDFSYTSIAGQQVMNEILGQAWDADEANGGANPFWFDAYKLVFQLSSLLDTENQDIEKGLAYPNPFKDHITFTLPRALASEGLLSLYNHLGKMVSKAVLKSGTKSISLTNGHLANGMYFAKISSDTYNQTIKIIKE
ncbi:T9SS type A sorting domain-containing protein [Aestuariivivens sediminicola]|uniref:T9SS type A sorting domain-containing protein n=1 Tax=Aestuariivivens sediminicola TaxID=2913560 RepID=UPI001F5A5CA0|nr:T9SS type A sorting domain-containing protein [Aestuariivivens sediminicola]